MVTCRLLDVLQSIGSSLFCQALIFVLTEPVLQGSGLHEGVGDHFVACRTGGHPVGKIGDITCFQKGVEDVDEGHIHCPEGYYTVFFPSDIHRPLLAVDDKPIKIRKVVVKVHVSLLGE